MFTHGVVLALTTGVRARTSNFAIIPDPEVRRRFEEAQVSVIGEPNLFGLVALEAAFRYGDEWLEQVVSYIRSNLRMVLGWFKRELPEFRVMVPEASYLVWVDCREFLQDPKALSAFFRDKAKLAVTDGYKFGPGGEGFVRLNIASLVLWSRRPLYG